MEIDKETLRVVIAQIDKGIEAAEREIGRLKRAKAKLQSGNFTDSEPSFQRTHSGRLPRGVPYRLTLESFQKYRRLSVRGIQENVKADKDIDLPDGSIRRVLRKLEKENRISPQEDGCWILITSKEGEEDDDSAF